VTPALPFVRWLPQWRQKDVLRADLLAGLTGAIVVLPEGVAFATLAGMPPAYGLYAAMVPCIVAALFGSSRLMVTGPANAISLTTMALVAPLAAVGSSQYVGLVLTLTFIVRTRLLVHQSGGQQLTTVPPITASRTGGLQRFLADGISAAASSMLRAVKRAPDPSRIILIGARPTLYGARPGQPACVGQISVGGDSFARPARDCLKRPQRRSLCARAGATRRSRSPGPRTVLRC